jgi:hypothetical protein
MDLRKMSMRECLEHLSKNGSSKEIMAVASEYIRFCDEGLVGGNSVGALGFCQFPEKYVKEWGAVILGVE